MDYIIKKDYESIIYKNNDNAFYKGYERIISVISKEYFLDLKKYNKYVGESLNIKRNIPIHLSNNLMLFKIKLDNMEYYINYYNIIYIGYDKLNVLIIFKSGAMLYFKYKIIRLKKIIEKCQKIDDYIYMLDRIKYK